MDIQTELLREHSKAQTLRLVAYIGNNTERLSELIHLFLKGEPLERQRSAWVVYHFTPEQRRLSQPYFKAMVERLTPDTHPAVWRATLRLFYYAGIPEEEEGRIITLAFQVLEDSQQAIAAKVFAMSILGNFCQKEPDLAAELKLLIEEQMPHGSAGFKSRGKKVLKAIEKLI